MNIHRKTIFFDYLLETPNYIAIFISGFFIMIASPVLLEMSKAFNAEVGNISFIFTFYSIGSMGGIITSIFYSRRFKKIKIFTVFYLLLISVILLLYFSSSLIMFYTLYFISGYILGVIFNQANEFLFYSKIQNKDKLVLIAHIFWPIGAILGPIVSSNLVGGGLPWNFIYFVILIIIAINLILYILFKRSHHKLEKIRKNNSSIKMLINKRRYSLIIFIFTAFSMVFYVMSESVISVWMPTFFRANKSFSIQDAGFAVSLFWVSIIIGRLIISFFLVEKINARYLITLPALFGLFILFFTIFLNNQNIVFLTLILVGLSYSGIFPLLLSRISNYSEKNKGLFLTGMLISADIGFIATPSLTRLFAKYNMTISVLLSVFSILCYFIFVLLSLFFEKKFGEEKINILLNKK